MINLLYLAKPKFGGWVTFTAHLFHCLSEKDEVNLFRMGRKNSIHDFGYGVNSLSIGKNQIGLFHNLIITAIDKTHYEFLDYLKEGTSFVIHDPTELKDQLVKHLKRFKVITIRKTVQKLLKETYGIESQFIPHPFYQYKRAIKDKTEEAVSVSRIDFDKHIDIILKANKKLKKPIKIYGAINRLYVHFKLKDLFFSKYYKGSFNKDFNSLNEILGKTKFLIDMSAIKNDGSGTQYTFLEGIYEGCLLFLNKKWFESGVDVLKPGINCVSIEDEEDLRNQIQFYSKRDNKKMISEAKKILKQHILKGNIL